MQYTFFMFPHFYVHIDADSFFVACERTRNRRLIGKPVAVGGRGDRHIFEHSPMQDKQLHLLNEGHFVQAVFANTIIDHVGEGVDGYFKEDGRIRGIVIAGSYEAKGDYGIKTGMTVRESLARCPHLIVLPPNHLLYHQISHGMQRYLASQCALVESYSIDEMFLDYCGMLESLDQVVAECERLQSEIVEKFGIPCSFGVSDRSKWAAKYASDRAKPFGIKTIPSSDWLSYIKDHDISEFPGIGRAFQKKLRSRGIDTLGECVERPQVFENWEKIGGKELYRKIMGIDHEPIHPSRTRKGVGISRNFDPITDRLELQRRIKVLCRHLSHTIQTLGVHPVTFHFSMRYEMGFRRIHKSVTERRLFNIKWLEGLACRVILEELDTHKIYAVNYLSVSGSNFLENKKQTLNLLEIEADRKQKKLDEALLKVRKKYGMDIVRNGGEV